MQGEDVQNEGRAVDDLHGLVHDLLQIGLLGRCQLVVEDDKVGLARPCQLGDFVGLARADEGARVGCVQALGRRGHHVGSGRIGQTFQLGKGRFQGPRQPRALDAHENGALSALLGLGGRAFWMTDSYSVIACSFASSNDGTMREGGASGRYRRMSITP